MRKPTENQKRVASKIKSAILKGERINKSKIARECGYAEASVRSMRPYNTKAFQQENESIQRFIERELRRIQRAMEDKDLSKERYNTLVDAMDKLQKNALLLAGEATENVEYRIIEG